MKCVGVFVPRCSLLAWSRMMVTPRTLPNRWNRRAMSASEVVRGSWPTKSLTRPSSPDGVAGGMALAACATAEGSYCMLLISEERDQKKDEASKTALLKTKETRIHMERNETCLFIYLIWTSATETPSAAGETLGLLATHRVCAVPSFRMNA